VTHYTIDYGDLQEPEKARKALADIAEYLGAERFNKFTVERMKEPAMPRIGFIYAVSFGGVQGYPAHAWYEHIWQPTQHDMHVCDYYLHM